MLPSFARRNTETGERINAEGRYGPTRVLPAQQIREIVDRRKGLRRGTCGPDKIDW